VVVAEENDYLAGLERFGHYLEAVLCELGGVRVEVVFDQGNVLVCLLFVWRQAGVGVQLLLELLFAKLDVECFVESLCGTIKSGILGRVRRRSPAVDEGNVKGAVQAHLASLFKDASFSSGVIKRYRGVNRANVWSPRSDKARVDIHSCMEGDEEGIEVSDVWQLLVVHLTPPGELLKDGVEKETKTDLLSGTKGFHEGSVGTFGGGQSQCVDQRE